jgi:signal peptidase I
MPSRPLTTLNRISRAGRWLVYAAGSLCLGLLLAAFLPTFFGYEALVVGGGSMGRSVPVGSVAVTRMVDVKAVGQGDVISFRHPGRQQTITHRVTSVGEENGQRIFTTKGDASAAPDPQPARFASGEVARLQWVIPYAGYIVVWGRTPGGLVLFIAAPLLGLVLLSRTRMQIGRIPVQTSHDEESPPRVIDLTDKEFEQRCPHCGDLISVSISKAEQKVKEEVKVKQPGVEWNLPFQEESRDWLHQPANRAGR